MQSECTPIFLQVPHSNDHAISETIRNMYGTKKTYTLSYPARSTPTSQDSVPDCNAIVSTLGLASLEVVDLTQPVHTLSILCHPFDRVARHTQYFLNQQFPKCDLSLEALCSKIDPHSQIPCRFWLDNLQVRLFCGDSLYDQPSQLTPDHLALAKDNLRSRIDFIGIAELMPETLFLLGETLDWQPSFPYTLNGPSRDTHQLSRSDWQFISQLTSMDMELYDFACQSMLNRLSTLDSHTRKRLEVLLATLSPSPTSRFCHFNAEQYLALNPDIAQSGINPLSHYLFHGQFENRPGTPFLPHQALRATKACSVPWSSVSNLESEDSDKCPYLKEAHLDSNPNEFMTAVGVHLLAGEPSPKCQSCNLKQDIQLKDYVEHTRQYQQLLLSPLSEFSRNQKDYFKATSPEAQLVSQVFQNTNQPLIDQKNRLLLGWSAKAGSIFAVSWMFDQLNLLQVALHYHYFVHRFREYYLHHPEYLNAVENFRNQPTSYRIVKVVRNPFDRAVSSYIHATRYNYEDVNLSRFLGRSLSSKERFSFREFIGYLETIDLTHCNPHHRQQFQVVDQLAEQLDIEYHVVQLEDSFRLFPELEEKLQLKPTKPDNLRQLDSRALRDREANDSFFGDWIPESAQKDLRFPPSINFYDSELRSKVATLYKIDFEKFHYFID